METNATHPLRNMAAFVGLFFLLIHTHLRWYWYAITLQMGYMVYILTALPIVSILLPIANSS